MEQLHLFVRQAFPQKLRDLLRFFDRIYDHPPRSRPLPVSGAAAQAAPAL